MPSVFQLTSAAVICAVLMLVLRSRSGEFALLLSLMVCALLGIAALRGLNTLLQLMEQLASLAQVDALLVGPLLRTTGIALITGIGAQLCRDAGAGGIAMTLELCGGLCAIYAALPLIQAVFDMLRELI